MNGPRKDLELVSSTDLIDELLKRHDVTFATYAKYKGERDEHGMQCPSIAKWANGPTLEIIGLAVLSLFEMIQEIIEGSEEDDSE